MTRGIFRKPLFALGTAALSLFIYPALPAARADDLDQRAAQVTNASAHHKGSDDSVDECTRHAMRAFMDLAALNIGGAISNGYHAYGNYINSDKMDDLEARSKAKRNIMGSVGVLGGDGGQASGVLGDKNTGSSISGRVYSQMDTGFLYQGETAEVAAEFEKKSGMKREDFFKHMAAGLDSHPTWDDPNLMQKLEGHFNDFKNAVPNKDFREGLDRAQNSIPNFMRTKLMGEIQSFYADAYKGFTRYAGGDGAASGAGSGGANGTEAVAGRDLASAQPTSGASLASGAGGSASATGGADAMGANGAADKIPGLSPNVADAIKGRKIVRDIDGMFIGIRSESKDALRDILSGPPVLSGEQESIFKVVSKRYRLLTPALLGRASVLESK